LDKEGKEFILKYFEFRRWSVFLSRGFAPFEKKASIRLSVVETKIQVTFLSGTDDSAFE
jgi:hypothetical protein